MDAAQDAPTSTQRYHRVAILLHWLMALIILVMIPFGFLLEELGKAGYGVIAYPLHKSFGLTILALTGVRILWRILHHAPTLPLSTPRWQRIASRLVHVLLYVLMLGLPLSGWMMISTSAKTYVTTYFGLFVVPNLPLCEVGSDQCKPLNGLFYESHETLAYIAIALILLHVAAALKHHTIDKDGVMTRMLPRRCYKKIAA
jgi:cytochrome b561